MFPCLIQPTIWELNIVDVTVACRLCIDVSKAVLIPSLIYRATLQVAALQFGDFYNMQYVKMYTIFMMQLQVKT